MDFSNYDSTLYLPNQPEFITRLHPTLDYLGKAEECSAKHHYVILSIRRDQTKVKQGSINLAFLDFFKGP